MFHFVPRCIGIAMTYYLSVAWSDGMCDIDMSNTPFPISLTFGRHGVTKRTLVDCKYRHALRAKHFGSRAFWRGRPRAVLSFVFYAIWEAYMMLKAPTHVPAKFHIDTWNAPWAPQVRRRGLRDPKLLQPTESQRYRCPTASQHWYKTKKDAMFETSRFLRRFCNLWLRHSDLSPQEPI